MEKEHKAIANTTDAIKQVERARRLKAEKALTAATENEDMANLTDYGAQTLQDAFDIATLRGLDKELLATLRGLDNATLRGLDKERIATLRGLDKERSRLATLRGLDKERSRLVSTKKVRANVEKSELETLEEKRKENSD